MPRYQLQIREPGRPPRIVPLAGTVVVGRSRRADVPIEDEEVGREQFRIGITDRGCFLEGIGKTNKTFVEGAGVGPGQRVDVRTGTPIQVGRTTFVVQPADLPPPPDPNQQPDATMIAPRPRVPLPAPAADAGLDRNAAPPPAAVPPPEPSPEQERTGGGISPAKAGDLGMTMPPQAYRPGAAKGPAEGDGRTMPLAAGNPGHKAPAPAPAAAENTMPPQSYRPGGARRAEPAAGPSDESTLPLPPRNPGSKPPAPPAAAAEQNLTLPPSAGYRPGQSQPESRPQAPASPPAAPAPQVAPPVPPRIAAPAPAAASPPPSGAGRAEPPRVSSGPATTRIIPGQLPPEAAAKGLPPAELESSLHLSLPHVLAKGDGVRRRQRLIKLRNMVGRGINVDVLLPSESVSEEHAEIVFDGSTWLLRDLGSTNGTTVDGQSLKNATAPLRRHSLLAFGNVRAIFLCCDPRAPLAHKKLDARAVRNLVATGRIGRAVADQAMQVARTDGTLSLPEILLTETALEPQDWHLAVQQASRHRGPFGWLLGLFRRR